MRSMERIGRILLVCGMFVMSCQLTSRATPTPEPVVDTSASAALTRAAGAADSETAPANTPAPAGEGEGQPDTNATATPLTDSTPEAGATPDISATTIPAGTVQTLPPPPVTNTLPEFQPPELEPASLDDIVAQANQLGELFEQLQQELDPSQFDLTERNFAANFDPEILADFVRQDIAFEQYPGVLRGAYGTMLGRAGNALDQAMLLSSLLQEAGYETRYLRSTLSESQARTLINQMVVPVSRPIAPPAVAAVGSEIALIQGFTPESHPGYFSSLEALPADPYLAVTDNDTQFILDALAAAGITPGDPNALADLIAEAQDYFWVEYRLDGFDNWQSLHPVFSISADAPTDLEAEETFLEVPDGLFHRFRFEVYIEQKVGEDRFVRPVVTNQETTTAALVGLPFTYQNRPNNLDPDDFPGFEAMLADTGIFYPLINGGLGGSGFDYDGRIFELELLALDTMGARELFQAVAGNVENAIGLLGGLAAEEGDGVPEDPNDYFTLTAQWIEYTLIAPGGGAETFRRTVMDRLPPEARMQEEISFDNLRPLSEVTPDLLTEYTISVLPAAYNSDYALERLSERMLGEVELINIASQATSAADVPIDKVSDLTPYIDVVLQAALEEGQRRQDVISYRDRAAVVVQELGIVLGSEETNQRERIDIVSNRRRVFEIQDGQPVPSLEGTIRAGVWETAAERLPLLHRNGNFFDTRTALQQARDAGISFVVIPPGQANADQLIEHDPQTEISVQQDLDRGYAVIIPQSAAPGAEASGWWRVDPTTGETLGVVTGGYGAEAVEYFTLFFSIVNGGISAGSCIADGSHAGCCFAMAFVSFFITFTSVLILSLVSFLAAGAAAAEATSILLGISVDAFSLGVPNFCS